VFFVFGVHLLLFVFFPLVLFGVDFGGPEKFRLVTRVPGAAKSQKKPGRLPEDPRVGGSSCLSLMLDLGSGELPQTRTLERSSEECEMLALLEVVPDDAAEFGVAFGGPAKLGVTSLPAAGAPQK